MLILQPTAGEKTITIAPRSEYYNSLKSRALNDGGVFESSNCFTLFSGINYSINLRRDGDGNEGKLFYRDKIYVTSQTSTERETNKYEIGNGTIYKPFSDSDDNTYII